MSNLTLHAATRMQQRNISSEIIDFLIEGGKRQHDRRGSMVVYFNKHSRHRLLRQVGEEQYRRLESKLNTYAVLSSTGEVLTVGHRSKRINRH